MTKVEIDVHDPDDFRNMADKFGKTVFYSESHPVMTAWFINDNHPNVFYVYRYTGKRNVIEDIIDLIGDDNVCEGTYEILP